MGDFEIFLSLCVGLLLSYIVYSFFVNFFSIDYFLRFNFFKYYKNTFYECGFKSKKQKNLNVTNQYIGLIVLFLLYDIDFIFLFPLATSFVLFNFIDLFLFFFFFFIILYSFLFEVKKNLIFWQF